MDRSLIAILSVVLGLHFFHVIPASVGGPMLGVTAVVATIPVLVSALSALRGRKITVDLLAAIALVVSVAGREWAVGRLHRSHARFGRIIGPEGVAAYNFLTDFIPLANSARLFGVRIRQ